LASLISEQPS